MILFLLQILLVHRNCWALPVEPVLHLEPSTRRFDRLISSVVRQIGENDIIHPSICPSSCEHLHHAIPFIHNHSDITTSIKECSCICPLSRPAYVSSAASCVDRLSECPNTIRWKSLNSPIPVIQLAAHTIILPDDELDFRASGIRPSSRGVDEWNCGVKQILYENLNSKKWKMIPKERGLFQLTTSNEKPIVYFGGTEFDAQFLSGAVVMIKLECGTFASSDPSPFCISLRIAGTSGTNSNFDNNNFDGEDTGWRIETVFLLVVVALIIIVLIITFVVWNICWSMKKRKLISDFQMQFVQQYKQNIPQSPNGSEFEEIDEQEMLQTHSLPMNRKRLIFSAEYFDSAQMTHPSPLAIQFLYDLRRVVDVAKERIRQRRFIPALPVIIEEVEKEYVYEEDQEQGGSLESSPRSEPKSVDSGRESREDGEDSEEEEDEEEEERRRKKEEENEQKVITQTKVSDIVKSFEKSSTPRRSHVPIMLNSSMRKKKPLSTTTTTTAIGDPPVKPSEPVFQSKIRAPTAFSDRKSPRERKGYAVFPSDGTFNKSLPRRAKRFSNPATATAKS